MADDSLREVFNGLDGSVEARRGTLRLSAIAAYAACVCQFAALSAVIVVIIKSAPMYELTSSPEYAALDSKLLQQLWVFRRDIEPIEQIWGVLACVAQLLIIPIFQALGQIFRRNYLSTCVLCVCVCALLCALL